MQKVRILLAEDDLDDQGFFFNFLKGRSDIELLPAAENGEEVLAFLDKAEEGLPDIIILDQNMPKMNGLQTLLALKKETRFSQLPLIIYSTYIDDNLMNQALAAGAALVLNKPNTASDYHQLIDRILEYRKAIKAVK